MTIRIINAAEVRRLLPMDECIDVMAKAMVATSTGTVSIPLRTITPLIDKSGLFAMMPGSSADPEVYGAKVLSLHPQNPSQGRPLIQGFVTLFDHETGAPVAIIEGAEITAIRTAAASGLGTRELARKDAKTHGIFGTGVQAISHIDAIQAARPGIGEIIIWGRSFEKAQALANEQAARTGIACRATDNPEEAAACDVVSTVTGSSEPVLLGQWLRPGTHVNLVGAHTPATREADTEVMARSRVYVDLMESAMNEAGEILIPIQEGAITRDYIVGEIGAVVAGNVKGRESADQITVYKSVGMTAQDLFAAWHILKRARAENMDTILKF